MSFIAILANLDAAKTVNRYRLHRMRSWSVLWKNVQQRTRHYSVILLCDSNHYDALCNLSNRQI